MIIWILFGLISLWYFIRLDETLIPIEFHLNDLHKITLGEGVLITAIIIGGFTSFSIICCTIIYKNLNTQLL